MGWWGEGNPAKTPLSLSLRSNSAFLFVLLLLLPLHLLRAFVSSLSFVWLLRRYSVRQGLKKNTPSPKSATWKWWNKLADTIIKHLIRVLRWFIFCSEMKFNMMMIMIIVIIYVAAEHYNKSSWTDFHHHRFISAYLKGYTGILQPRQNFRQLFTVWFVHLERVCCCWHSEVSDNIMKGSLEI